MQITKNSVMTNAGPREWFTGAVFVDPVAAPSGPSRLSASTSPTKSTAGNLGDHVLKEKRRSQFA